MKKDLFTKEKGRKSRWYNFENPTGAPGQGGTANGGAKGHAFERWEPGETKVLMDQEGPGVIHRIWMTLSRNISEILPGLVIEMFWDGAAKPAVSVPLADFFCATLGEQRPFESVFFSNPEGRSFNCTIDMPFLTYAKVIVRNTTSHAINHLFYEINATLMPVSKDILYFHSFWNRENPVPLAQDYTILPKLAGEGKFIGVNLGVRVHPGYENSWFGEGEVKIYLDGDRDFPTLCGTGTEDYIGTAWGQGEYAHMTQGCLVADKEKGIYTFYRFHESDPVYFYQDLTVRIQNLGGHDAAGLLKILESDRPAEIVSSENAPDFNSLYKTGFQLTADSQPGWYNFYRSDDFSSTAYFYLDKPCSDLPGLQ